MVKNIVDQEHVVHDLKWPVIIYLHYFECMTENEISEWLFANTYWKDLSNIDVTNYHIGWSCNLTREAFKRNMNDTSRPVDIMVPLPREVMKDLRVSRFASEFAIGDQRGWDAFNRYILGINNKFSGFLESEQYAK